MDVRKMLRNSLVVIFYCLLPMMANAIPYYIQKANPWGQGFNLTAMDHVYGAGNWAQGNYLTPAATIFSPSTQFVMLEGSEVNDSTMEQFLSANMSLIESWVYHGGNLFINGAMNYIDTIHCGFDSTLIYHSISMNAQAVTPDDPIFLGPYLPTATQFTGNYMSHGVISGIQIISLLDASPNMPSLVRKVWGSGNVFFGALTQPNWWQQQPEGANVWYNIIYTAANMGSTIISDSFSVTVQKECSGPVLKVNTVSYEPGMTIVTDFGDNSAHMDSILNGPYGGYANVSHVYALNGTYTIKQVLYDSAAAIDSIIFSYEHSFCAVVPVKFFLDTNSNCLKDSLEKMNMLPVLTEVDSNGVPVATISATSGFYYFTHGNPGDVYQFKVINVGSGLQVSCPANGILSTVFQSGIVIPDQLFALKCSGASSFDLSVNLQKPNTGIFDQSSTIYVQNDHCQAQNGTVTLHYSPKYSGMPTAINPPATSVSGNAIVWDLSSLSVFDPQPIRLRYALLAGATNLTIGDTVMTHVEVTPAVGDQNQTNNIVIRCDTVKASCDPNLIAVTPEGVITAGTQLKYEIEFENVGNDTAHNIYVLDTLPNEVDVNSLRVQWASHIMYLSHYNDGTHNIVKWDFPNIKLLDSSYHNDCTGMFYYTINSKTGLPDGTFIDHRAGIYFDDNGLVLTNTVRNIIGSPVVNVSNVKAADKLLIYPNPASTELNVKMEEGAYDLCSIMNSMGQVVMTQALIGTQTKLNIKGLPAGMYYISLKGDKGNEVRKFVK